MKNRVWRLSVALISLCALGAPAFAADEVPDATAIRAKVRAAGGPIPENYRETDETISSDGTTTIEHDYKRGENVRYTFDSGPFHTESGTYDRQDWYMNDNSQVVLDQPDPGQAVAEKTTATVKPVRTPVEGYVIATLNARGDGTREYVDGATWQIVRRERITPNGTIVTTYDDVRADHGRTFAHHYHVENGYARTSSDIRITDYVPDVVTAADVAIPVSRRSLVTFPAGVRSVELPTKFGQSHVYVRVMINGRGLDFVLDSGASEITIDSRVARELGLPEYGRRSAVTAGRYTTARTIVPEMRIGSLVMRDVAMQEVPHGWNVDPSVKAVGLLGFDFLAELGVTIDYENERVTVVPEPSYVPPTDKHTIPLDVRVGSGTPMVSVSVNGAVGERWVLDTGGAGTFMIFDYFARRYPEALRDQGGGGDARQTELYGIGGTIDARPYQIASLRLANLNFTRFVGFRVTGRNSYAESDDGVVGTDFLRLFTLGFDYGNSRVYLTPNKSGRAAMGIK
jgi:predicted aspartyl protease